MRWIAHRGGPCPVAANTLVLCRIRALTRTDAEKRPFIRADGWRNWQHRNFGGDIIEFQTGGTA